MCFELDSLPPILPIAGAAVDSEDLELEASDGTKFAAFEARAEEPLGPAVLVLPDVRGLYRFYEELALRFAERGYDTVVIDYFGRTAGIGKRDDEFPFMDHVMKTSTDGIAADTRAAVERLRSRGGQSDRKVFTVGFCFGGSNSWTQAANGHGLAGVVGFYGHPTRAGFPGGAQAVIERVGEFSCPVLGLLGGADESIPKQEIDAFDEALGAAGVEHELITYPDAPHSFFDRSFAEHAEASADAWERVLSFIEENS